MHVHMHLCMHIHMHAGGPAIAAGEEHSLWLHADGSVWAAGGNKWGQLGDGTNIDSLTFKNVVSSGQCDSKGVFIESVCACVCVCACVRAHVCVCVCVCVKP